MSKHGRGATPLAEPVQEERREFRAYILGAGIALALTVVPFALVQWPALPRLTLLIVIGVLALVQILVHFRFFLHISFAHKREDLQLIVFSALLLTIMVVGTIWIMASLALRMGNPASPWMLKIAHSASVPRRPEAPGASPQSLHQRS